MKVVHHKQHLHNKPTSQAFLPALAGVIKQRIRAALVNKTGHFGVFNILYGLFVWPHLSLSPPASKHHVL